MDWESAAKVQIKSRERVRELAEVYTHKREVEAMLALVADMFPSDEDPANTDRKFFEPACGSGNFIEEILRRKLAFVTTARYGKGERYEHRILRALASIYAVDISADNVHESRDRMRALINSHLDMDLNTVNVTAGFASAVDVILSTNIVLGDTVNDRIELVEYKPGKGGTFMREWSFLGDAPDGPLDLFFEMESKADGAPVHYADLADRPSPSKASAKTKTAASETVA